MKKRGETTKAGGLDGATTNRRKDGRGRKPANSPAKAGAISRIVSAAASTSVRDKGTIRQLRSALSRALRLIQQLQASAETDFLLGILNRRGFERELTRAIAYIKRYHTTAALIVLDVDRLKPINDAFGHGAGDEVLKAIVSVLGCRWASGRGRVRRAVMESE